MAEGFEILFEGRGLVCVRGARLVFQGLDFALPPGGALMLAGANGSGKSSLLRLMAGFTDPSAGQLLWNGEPISTDRKRHGARIQFIGHTFGTKAAMTVREDLSFWSTLRGSCDPEELDRALNHFGLSSRGDSPVRFLSSGQKCRLALARLIATPASLWLLDEPTVGLDNDGKAALESSIATFRETGGVVVVASHTPIELGADVNLLELTRFAVPLEAHDLEGLG